MVGRIFRREVDYFACLERIATCWGGASLSPFGVRLDLSHLGSADVWT